MLIWILTVNEHSKCGSEVGKLAEQIVLDD